MAICRQACSYNTLDGCKVKAYGGVCPLTNTAQPITEYKMTNADRIRSMNDEELAMFLCDFRSCDADEYICEGCKAAQYCRAGHAGTIDWLQQPGEDIDDAT